MNRLTHKYLHGGYWASIFKVSACGENECKGEIIDRLAEYENAEEQGLLVQMPCKQGTRVYYITRNHIEVGQYCAKANGNESIISTDKYGRVYWCDDDDWFYTYDVAKKVLAKRNAQNARKASECLLCRFSDIQRVCADKKAGITCEFYRGEQE